MVEDYVISAGKRTVSRRRHARRDAGGFTEVRRHNMNIGRFAKAIGSNINKTVIAVKKYQVESEKARRDSFVKEMNLKNEALVNSEKAMKLRQRAEELKLDIEKSKSDFALKERLTREQVAINEALAESEQRRQLIEQKYREVTARAGLEGKAEQAAVSKYAALKAADEYRRTRIPFKEGSALSKKAGELQARAELEGIRSRIISERVSALKGLKLRPTKIKGVKPKSVKPVGPTRIDKVLDLAGKAMAAEAKRTANKAVAKEPKKSKYATPEIDWSEFDKG